MIADALDTLGKKIDAGQQRDAVHVAVLPAQAAHRLIPGEHVGIVDGMANADAEHKVGIADPFLTDNIEQGEYIWILIYPRQITSLRHEWEHPGFKPETDPKAASEAWLRAFVDGADCPSYEQVIAKAMDNDSWSPEYLHFDDYDAHGEIPNEFWDHLEVVTGQKFTERAEHFSCSC